jgi:hypothetical protein
MASFCGIPQDTFGQFKRLYTRHPFDGLDLSHVLFAVW